MHPAMTEVRKKAKRETGDRISAVGGTIVGRHEVLFAGEDEVIEFKHALIPKAVFAEGVGSMKLQLGNQKNIL